METTPALSVDVLMSLPDKELKKYWYERTALGVRKLVDHKNCNSI